MTPSDDWTCPAYGSEGVTVGALCFFSRLYERSCLDVATCHRSLQVERTRIFDRLQHLAAAGDRDLAAVVAAFESPDQLLGGPEAPLD